jgi:hypothetical protein
MEQISEDWEVVSRKSRYPIFNAFMTFLLDRPATEVIWMLRQKSTGVVRRVIACDEPEAIYKAAQGSFEPD